MSATVCLVRGEERNGEESWAERAGKKRETDNRCAIVVLSSVRLALMTIIIILTLIDVIKVIITITIIIIDINANNNNILIIILVRLLVNLFCQTFEGPPPPLTEAGHLALSQNTGRVCP